MNLFEIKNNKLVFAPESLALAPFKALWDRDKSKDKYKAVAELAAIYFYADLKSDFSGLMNESDRLKEVRVYIPELGEDWKPDEMFNNAVSFYKEKSLTVTTKLLEDARMGLQKIGKFLRNVDLMATDEKGRPLYNAKQYADTQKAVAEIVISHNKLEELVKKEQVSKKDTVGSKDKNMFEDEDY